MQIKSALNYFAGPNTSASRINAQVNKKVEKEEM